MLPIQDKDKLVKINEANKEKDEKILAYDEEQRLGVEKQRAGRSDLIRDFLRDSMNDWDVLDSDEIDDVKREVP